MARGMVVEIVDISATCFSLDESFAQLADFDAFAISCNDERMPHNVQTRQGWGIRSTALT